jgi:hypothetical protein
MSLTKLKLIWWVIWYQIFIHIPFLDRIMNAHLSVTTPRCFIQLRMLISVGFLKLQKITLHNFIDLAQQEIECSKETKVYHI